jgi:D-amino peptidase
MPHSRRRLYVLCDIEGASGISPANRDAMMHGSEAWSSQGRASITSDLVAVCDAAHEFGIDEIIVNDDHDGGRRMPNVLADQLPSHVRLLRRPHLPGKARHVVGQDAFGMIIVGQHAMAGGGGFAPHTIAWPFAEVTINGRKVGEIGIELAVFMGTPLLAVIGEQAAVDEAQALCPTCVGVPVKSLESDWFPTADEMRPIIRQKTLEALRRRDEMTGLQLDAPFRFTLRPHEKLRLDREKRFFLRTLSRYLLFRRCKGEMSENEVSWETRTVIGGLYLLQMMRAFMVPRLAE